MHNHGPPPDRIAELARARGATVLSDRQMASGEHVQQISFPTHLAKIAFFADLAGEYARDQEIQALARSIVGCCADKSQAGRIAAVHRWVTDQIVLIGEPIEMIPNALQIAYDGCGDCDDMTVLLIALLRAIGERAGFAWLGDPPRHAAAAVWFHGQWEWLEPTIEAIATEHPLAAAQRLGITARRDIHG